MLGELHILLINNMLEHRCNRIRNRIVAGLWGVQVWRSEFTRGVGALLRGSGDEYAWAFRSTGGF